MTMGNILRSSMEDAGVDVVNEDERNEAQIDMDEYRDSVVKVDQLEAQAELITSLERLVVNTRALVTKETASAESAALITTSLESMLGDADLVSSACMSFESGADVGVYHNHVAATLESMVTGLAKSFGEGLATMGSYYDSLPASMKEEASPVTQRLGELNKWFSAR